MFENFIRLMAWLGVWVLLCDGLGLCQNPAQTWARPEPNQASALQTTGPSARGCGSESNCTWGCLFAHAASSFQQGRIPEAEEGFRLALIQANSFQIDDLRRLCTLRELGTVLQEEAKFSEAEKVYTRALRECKAAFGAEHRTTAAVLNDLAILYLMSGHYSKAEALMYQSLAIIQMNAGSESAEYAIGAANLGSLYLRDRNYSRALPLLGRSVAVLKSRRDHRLEYATALNNLGNVRQQQGEYTKAEAFYKEALEILEGSEDRNRLRVAIILEDRAMLLAKMEQHEQAEALYKRSLGLFEGLFGPDSPRLIGVLTQYAIFLRSRDRKEESRQLERRAREIRSADPDQRRLDMSVDIRNVQPASEHRSRH